jgi:hypothetical protein
MNRHSLYVLVSAAILSGLIGTARAELNDSPLPSQAQAKVEQPAPAPAARSHHATATRRAAAERPRLATMSERPRLATISMLQPACASFACDQYLIVGIGF